MILNKITIFISGLKLRWKFSFIILSMVLVMGTLVFLTIKTTLSGFIQREIENHGIFIGRSLAANSIDLLLVDNKIRLQLLVNDIVDREEGVQYVYIHDSNREIIVHTFKDGFPSDMHHQHTYQSVQKSEYLLKLFDTETGLIQDVSTPILNWEAGAVHVGMRLSHVDQAVTTMNCILYGIILLISAMALMLAYFLSSLTVKPMEKLAEQAKKIGDGNFDLDIPTNRHDEVGKLSGSINKMAHSLKLYFGLREQAEQQLAAEKEQLAVTLRSIGDGVITTDIDGNIILMNKVSEQLTGWTQQAASGKPLMKIFNIIHKDTGNPCKSPFERVIKSGRIITLKRETTLISKSGDKRLISDSAAPIYDRNSALIGVVIVFRDITEATRMGEELIKAQKLESVGVLAGGIAHDFNNILAAILGNVDLVLSRSDPNDKNFKLLSNVEKASIRAKDLTQQLLTFSKGGAPLKKVTHIINIIKDSAEFVSRGSNIKCEYRFADDLSAVEIDIGQIGQVIQNLVINAIHAMPEGGIINITAENYLTKKSDLKNFGKDDYVLITIKDSGTGITADKLENIFDPYFTTKETGSGLGLAITHSIIGKHGGDIRVESEPGSGTSFFIYLPASKEKLISEEKEVSSIRINSSGKILIMDDDVMVREIANDMLSSQGYEVFEAKDGEQAISIYSEKMDSGHPIDLIFMDLTIPGGMGGQEAVKKILEIDPSAKVVVCSGYSTGPIMSKYQDYSFCGAIVKPYTLQEISKIVCDILVV